MFQFLKNAALGLLVFGISYAICVYLADFSTRQSIVVGIVGFFAIQGFRISLANAEQRFVPLRVSIAPDWSAICHDFNLVSEAEWSAIYERISKGSEGYNVLWNGLNYTTLSPTLFYSHDKKEFFTELNLREEIEEFNKGIFAPKFYAKRTLVPNGLVMVDFGIVRGASLDKNSTSDDPNFANVLLCRLPEIVFSKCAYDEEIDRRTKRHMTGWTLDGGRIDHKYVRIYCRAI